MDIQNTAAAPERVDFSKIKTSIPIPNLIEVQKNSYERFLQMDLLPNEREDIGLQTVFNSVFPISDFRGVSELEFVDYSIGNWECKCGNLERVAPPALHLPQAAARPYDRPVSRRRHALPPLRHVQQERSYLLQQVRRPGRPAAEVRHGGVPGARHDLRRSAQGHHPPDGLRQGSRNAAPRASAISKSRKSSSAKFR